MDTYEKLHSSFKVKFTCYLFHELILGSPYGRIIPHFLNCAAYSLNPCHLSLMSCMHDKYKTDSDISKTNISNTAIDGPGISVGTWVIFVCLWSICSPVSAVSGNSTLPLRATLSRAFSHCTSDWADCSHPWQMPRPCELGISSFHSLTAVISSRLNSIQ